ncbi:MAG: hypothetical protein EB051_03880 [Chlamydiia bacterium]|nr:hypothetical protein [Chlamydiia bacterium]
MQVIKKKAFIEIKFNTFIYKRLNKTFINKDLRAQENTLQLKPGLNYKSITIRGAMPSPARRALITHGRKILGHAQ